MENEELISEPSLYQYLTTFSIHKTDSDYLFYLFEQETVNGSHKEIWWSLCKHQHFNLLKTSFEFIDPNPGEFSIIAARYGHIDLLKWLHKREFCISKYVSISAAKYGYIKILRWLKEENIEINPRFYITAIKYKRMDILAEFFSVDLVKSTSIFNEAIKSNYLPVIKFLYHKGFFFNNKTALLIKERGSSDVKRWAESAFCPWLGFNNSR